MRKFLIILTVIAIIVIAYILLYDRKTANQETMEVPGVFVNTKGDLIQPDLPVPNSKVSSPLTISGKARGYWFFEASFPVQIVDSKGKILAEGPAQAQSDWMTEDFVPYKLDLNFTIPAGEASGKIILRKDNPSGLPENDDSLEIPVKFQ